MEKLQYKTAALVYIASCLKTEYTTSAVVFHVLERNRLHQS